MSNQSHAEKLSSHEIISLFPRPVYKTNIERKFTKQEYDEFASIITKDLDERASNQFKRITTDKYLLKRKSLSAIRSFIEQHLNEFCFSSNLLGMNKPKISCNITTSWLNLFEPRAFNPEHNHRNSILSGVLYINCLELPDNKPDGINFHGNGTEDFYSSSEMFHHIDLPITHTTTFSSTSFRIAVDVGDLILFPSTLRHSVDLNETADQTRISMSFNTFAFGELGDGDTSEVILKQGKL